MALFDACVFAVALLGLFFVGAQLLSAPRRARVLAVAWEPRLRKVVRETLAVHDEPILVDLWLKDVLANATVRDRLAEAVHEEFGVELTDAALRSIRTYGHLVRAVARALTEPVASDRLSVGDPRRAA